MITRTKQHGAVGAQTIIIVGLLVALLATGGVAVWTYLQYQEASTDVNGQIALAVSEAEKKQSELDEQKFFEREKEPNRQFVGPADYGRVTFHYPKTWSVHVAKDAAKGGDYAAYLNPIVVQPIANKERYALRVLIEDDQYEKVLDDYARLVKKGDVKTTNINIGGVNGTRVDGAFNKDIRGSAVIFKIRDKTLTIRTDSNTFKADFDKLIKSIEFNQ